MGFFCKYFWYFFIFYYLFTTILFGKKINLNRFNIELPESFSGPLLANSWLSKAEHLYRDEIRGPESFAIWNGKIYTGLHDGRIVEIESDRLRTVTHLDPENRGLEECRVLFKSAEHCSRPLGIRFSSNGSLYAVDPYHGIFRINVDDGHYQLVVDVNEKKLPDGSRARFLDDLVLIEDNGSMMIYMTDASQRWLLHQVFFTVGEHDQTGRLLSYNITSGEFKILADNLAFPNGLTVAADKTRILLNEFNKRRVLTYDLITGQLSVLVDGLPGEPDNIKPSLNGNSYWIGLFTGRNRHRPSFSLDIMAQYPRLQNFFFQLIDLHGYWLQQMAMWLNQDWLAEIGFNIFTGNFMYDLVAEYGLAIEIDEQGRIINSIHSPDGRISSLSEVYEYRPSNATDDGYRYFYLGSYSNRFLGTVRAKTESHHISYQRKNPVKIISRKPETTPNPRHAHQEL